MVILPGVAEPAGSSVDEQAAKEMPSSPIKILVFIVLKIGG